MAKLPLITPGAEITDAPGVCVFVNDDWWPYIVGVLERGLSRGYWQSGDDEKIGRDAILTLIGQEARCAGMSQYALIQHVEPNGTNAGASNVGWNKRKLNTVQPFGTLSGIQLSNDYFQLPLGIYHIHAEASSNWAGRNRLRLTDSTATIHYLNGLNNRAMVEAGGGQITSLDAIVKQWDFFSWGLFHYFTNAKTVNGLGIALSTGHEETYVSVSINRIGDV